MYTCPRPSCEALFKSDEAPADNVSNCWKFRVASGKSVIVVELSDCPVVASVVFTVVTCAVTSTTSLVGATFSDAIIRVVSVICTDTPGYLFVANPAAATCTVYVPTDKRVAVNCPDESVTSSRIVVAVDSLTTVTFAPANAAPDASSTVPLIAPVASP